jgi:hypothetical protein
MFAISCYSITLDEFQKVATGNVVHLKVEWQGKVYLEGGAVVAYIVGESAQLASTNPQNNFSGVFHRTFITAIYSQPNNEDLIKENTALKQKIVMILSELRRLVGLLEI